MPSIALSHDLLVELLPTIRFQMDPVRKRVCIPLSPKRVLVTEVLPNALQPLVLIAHGEDELRAGVCRIELLV